jgi:hypothetical protein
MKTPSSGDCISWLVGVMVISISQGCGRVANGERGFPFDRICIGRPHSREQPRLVADRGSYGDPDAGSEWDTRHLPPPQDFASLAAMWARRSKVRASSELPVCRLAMPTENVIVWPLGKSWKRRS